MKARPILFSKPMIRALLDGRKTQTRRVVKPQLPEGHSDAVMAIPGKGCPAHWRGRFGVMYKEPEKNWYDKDHPCHDFIPYPYGKPGDLLWVRESGYERPFYLSPKDMRDGADTWPKYMYMANMDDSDVDFCKEHKWKVRPSIHMPRKASRLTLRITNIRIERLQDMEGQTAFESDAIREGVNAIHHGDGEYFYHALRTEPHPENWCDPFDAFKELWQSINGADSWEQNPWVWVIEFEVIHKNVDQVLQQVAA